MSRIEVVLGGQGGQGIRFAGMVLGQACAEAGHHVTSGATYGPEVRGTFVRSEVIISSQPISYPLALSPQYRLVLSQEAYDRLRQEMPASAVVLFDPDAVIPSPEAPQRHRPVPAQRVAAELGQPGAANMVLLGAFCAFSRLVNLESLKQALPASHRQVNEAALERGYALGGEEEPCNRRTAGQAPWSAFC